MSNRHNGHGPLMAGQEFRAALEAAHEQGRQHGIKEAQHAIMSAPVTVRTIEFLEDGSATNKPFEPLSVPVPIARPGMVMVAGGMSVRLAVAASIVGHVCLDAPNEESACRMALNLAEALIEMERKEREAKAKPSEVSGENGEAAKKDD